MDNGIVNAAATFLLAAAGYLTAHQTHKAMLKRQRSKDSRLQDAATDQGIGSAGIPRTPTVSRLFPNGEKDEIINKINVLILENSQRRTEIEKNRIAHEEITSTLRDIQQRLARSGL